MNGDISPYRIKDESPTKMYPGVSKRVYSNEHIHENGKSWIIESIE